MAVSIAARDRLIGSVVQGKYRIRRLIARGGMASVYEAEQEPLGRLVALKVLRLPRGADLRAGSTSAKEHEFGARFLREASTLARLSHPSIVTAYDYGHFNDGSRRCFIAMELVRGETLQEHLSKHAPLPVLETVQLIEEIAEALSAAHAAGIVHRDLKPENILLAQIATTVRRAKIVDFGIAKILADGSTDAELTREGACVGSPRYMAPEQVAGRPVDGRADIYALGVIAFQCLSGRVPFDGQTALEVMAQHVRADVPPLRQSCSGCSPPAWLENLVHRCLEKDPSRRPQSALDVLNALHLSSTCPDEYTSAAAARRPSIQSLPHAVSMSSPPARSSWRRAPFLAAAAVALVSAGALAFRSMARPPDPSPRTSGAPVSAAATTPDTVVVTIESEPTGSVEQDGVPIGITPVTRRFAIETLQRRPVVFRIQAPGFAPVTIVQGGTTTNIQRMVTLVPISDGGPGSRPASAPARPTRTMPAPNPNSRGLILHR